MVRACRLPGQSQGLAHQLLMLALLSVAMVSAADINCTAVPSSVPNFYTPPADCLAADPNLATCNTNSDVCLADAQNCSAVLTCIDATIACFDNIPLSTSRPAACDTWATQFHLAKLNIESGSLYNESTVLSACESRVCSLVGSKQISGGACALTTTQTCENLVSQPVFAVTFGGAYLDLVANATIIEATRQLLALGLLNILPIQGWALNVISVASGRRQTGLVAHFVDTNRLGGPSTDAVSLALSTAAQSPSTLQTAFSGLEASSGIAPVIDDIQIEQEGTDFTPAPGFVPKVPSRTPTASPTLSFTITPPSMTLPPTPTHEISRSLTGKEVTPPITRTVVVTPPPVPTNASELPLQPVVDNESVALIVGIVIALFLFGIFYCLIRFAGKRVANPELQPGDEHHIMSIEEEREAAAAQMQEQYWGMQGNMRGMHPNYGYDPRMDMMGSGGPMANRPPGGMGGPRMGPADREMDALPSTPPPAAAPPAAAATTDAPPPAPGTPPPASALPAGGGGGDDGAPPPPAAPPPTSAMVSP